MIFNFAKKLGKEVVFMYMSFDLLYSALKIENLGLIGFFLVITQERLQLMDMIDIYGKSKAETTLIFWQKIPYGIQTIKDLKNISR